MSSAVSAPVAVKTGASPSRNREADPEVGYDESQRQALDLSVHMVVSAAAGSGKTRVLVGRYLRILEHHGHQPHRIVAITFTEEAASQMAARIREGVLARISSAPSPESKRSWDQALEALGDAPITTLHGFCLRILREHGSRIGLDPGFGVLNGGDQRLLLDRCLQELLDSWSRTRLPAFATLLRYLPYRRIEGVLAELVQRRNHLAARSSLDQGEILRRLYRRGNGALPGAVGGVGPVAAPSGAGAETALDPERFFRPEMRPTAGTLSGSPHAGRKGVPGSIPGISGPGGAAFQSLDGLGTSSRPGEVLEGAQRGIWPLSAAGFPARR